ncbi:MAG: nuclear transport factor 2 family protein [Actinomycetia bacterium]|nr:nuclear transport factor 2 family protein [Actinomycetes bacterium]
MNACYAPGIHFSDPVFRDLNGSEVKAMWHMLCERGTDLEVTFSDVTASGSTASARWEASYTLGGADRQIHNVITATFSLENDMILDHRDDFDLWKWTRMALGMSGTLLGWSGFVQNKVREQANRQLQRFIDDHPEYQ